ncbi:molybdopterin-dependent oxidoreductase [Aeromicrobium sp. CTD01-1L150]|uniref:molybdopterin-dependent oxidoreductase n=1 Tax=Aeromicrobium sp. CTD01-1L150 TaxID=3341830 RepID=UPI0035C25367
MEDIESRLESRVGGPRTASRLGLWLGVAFGICFLTGLWSHLQQDTPGWLAVPTSPASLYRVTQGLHVATGVATIPLLLVKLWSVFPRLFVRPPRGARPLLLHALERGSIAVLMASTIFMLVSGSLNVVQAYPWEFSFRATHYAMAWVAVGSILVHVAVKLPVIREALGAPIDDTRQEGPDTDGSTGAQGPTRRTVVGATLTASAAATVLTVGQSVTPLRRISVLGVRDGEGPQDLPVNRTAREAGATAAALDDRWRLEVEHDGVVTTFTRDELLALPQVTHRLPIACVEGWSRSADWTGVTVRNVLESVGVAPRLAVRVRSLQQRGAFAVSELPAHFVDDDRTLLALALNGSTLALDHGFPCRVIAPNRPGVLQTKWVHRLEVLT